MKTKQRGSGWSIALVFNLYTLFGYKFIYYLMYPVTFFYFLFATNVKDALQIYYKNIGLEFNNKIYFHHLRTFAICMVDRFISKLTKEQYEVQIKCANDLIESLEKRSILLQSHFGGWATSVNIGAKKVTNTINVVMQEALLDSIKSIEQKKEFDKNINIIDLSKDGIAVSVEIANALSKDEIVALMGDRAASEKAEVTLEFFGKKAKFNKNPFEIAYKTNTPVIIYFIILKGMKKYEINSFKIELNKDTVQEEAVLKAMKTYIKHYENFIKKYPNQWFNFYNFWE